MISLFSQTYKNIDALCASIPEPAKACQAGVPDQEGR
jgi:hypothetical protein